MDSWADRPTEIANLFNPAFCTIIIARAASAYADESGKGIPFALSFLILPTVLHEPTRLVFPRSKATSLVVWLQREPRVRVGFAERVRSLRDVTRESLLFGVIHARLQINSAGCVIGGKKIPRPNSQAKTADYRSCDRKAELFGKMLAKAGKPVAVFGLFGIAP